jgi:hypothetical protein
MFETWQDVIVGLVVLVTFIFGAPIIQLFKNLLSKIFKKTVEEKWALLLALVVSGGLGLLEMWLTGQLVDLVITPATLPAFISFVWGFAQVYYNLFKKSASVLGTKTLLTPPPAG